MVISYSIILYEQVQYSSTVQYSTVQYVLFVVNLFSRKVVTDNPLILHKSVTCIVTTLYRLVVVNLYEAVSNGLHHLVHLHLVGHLISMSASYTCEEGAKRILGQTV